VEVAGLDGLEAQLADQHKLSGTDGAGAGDADGGGEPEGGAAALVEFQGVEGGADVGDRPRVLAACAGEGAVGGPVGRGEGGGGGEEGEEGGRQWGHRGASGVGSMVVVARGGGAG